MGFVLGSGLIIDTVQRANELGASLNKNGSVHLPLTFPGSGQLNLVPINFLVKAVTTIMDSGETGNSHVVNPEADTVRRLLQKIERHYVICFEKNGGIILMITTFYFSGTGNSKWAAYELQRRLRKTKVKNRVYSIEEEISEMPELIKSSDGIAFVFPIYGMNIPGNMKAFIRSVNQTKRNGSEKCGVYIITTFGYVDGCGPYEVMKQLSSGQFCLMGYTGLKMANNICTPESYNKPLPKQTFNNRLEKSSVKISKLVKAIKRGKRKVEFGMYFLVGVFRKKMARIVDKGFKKLSIDNKRCTKCMLCVNNCPVDAIIEKGDQLVINSNCVCCMRCYNYCPNYAILHNGQYADPKMFERYHGPEEVIDK